MVGHDNSTLPQTHKGSRGRCHPNSIMFTQESCILLLLSVCESADELKIEAYTEPEGYPRSSCRDTVPQTHRGNRGRCQPNSTRFTQESCTLLLLSVCESADEQKNEAYTEIEGYPRSSCRVTASHILVTLTKVKVVEITNQPL